VSDPKLLLPLLQSALRAHALVTAEPLSPLDSVRSLEGSIAEFRDLLVTGRGAYGSGFVQGMNYALSGFRTVFDLDTRRLVTEGDAGRVQVNLSSLVRQLELTQQRLRDVIGDEPVRLGVHALREIYSGACEGLRPEEARRKLIDQWVRKLEMGLLSQADFALPPSWGGGDRVAAARAVGVEKLARILLRNMTDPESGYAAGHVDSTDLSCLVRPENFQAWPGLQGMVDALYVAAIERFVPQREEWGRARSVIEILKPHASLEPDVPAARSRSAERTMSDTLPSDPAVRRATLKYLEELEEQRVITRAQLNAALAKWGIEA
jgi:hypothetical protein